MLSKSLGRLLDEVSASLEELKSQLAPDFRLCLRTFGDGLDISVMWRSLSTDASARLRALSFELHFWSRSREPGGFPAKAFPEGHDSGHVWAKAVSKSVSIWGRTIVL